MKLSEAIRLGAMQLPPAGGGQVFRYDDADQICGACALGAAAFAVGIHHRIMAASAGDECLLTQRWPELLAELASPPVPWGLSPRNLAFWISGLHESYGWTREAIADWVATLEAQQESQPLLRVTELAEVV